jgi:hypothetical protein
VTADNCVYAAAITGDTLVVRRFRWDGHGDELDRGMWHLRPGFEDSQVLLVPPGADGHLLVHVVGHPQLAETKMAASSICKSEITCGAVDGMSDGVLAATRSEFGGLVLLERGAGKLELVTLRGSGPPHLLPLDIPAPAAASHTSPLPFHVRREVILLGLRNELMVVPQPHHRPTLGSSAVGKAIRVPSSLRLSGAISAIIGSPAHTRSRVALALDIGGVIYWDVTGAVEPSEIGGESSQRFSQDMLAPIVGLNRSGLLMAINSEQYEVYSTHNQRLQLVADGGLHSAEPIAVLAPPNVGQFGVMMRTGEMRILEVR